MYLIQTERLGLRNWQESDQIPYAEMNQDQAVMRFFPSVKTQAESVEQCHRFDAHFKEHGFTYFAVDRLEGQQFIGFIGMMYQTYDSPFTPCVDIGWRLQRSAWGQGFATEGAKACLSFAFEKAGLTEVYSVAPALNKPSMHVMEKIGMSKKGTFKHPAIGADSPLQTCCYFRIDKEAFKQLY